MVALWNRADHYIFALRFLSSFFSSPNLSGRRLDVDDWCGLSANLECMSEMCSTWLAENTGRKKSRQKSPSGTIAQLCRAISSQLRHVSTIGKNMLSSNMSSTCPHNMANFDPLTLLLTGLVSSLFAINTTT